MLSPFCAWPSLGVFHCCQCGNVASANVASSQLVVGLLVVGGRWPMISARQDAADGGAVALEHVPPITGETPAPVMLRQARPLGQWRGREGSLLDAADFAEALAADILQRSADEIEFPVVDDEETVMEQLVVADGEFRVLLAECQGIGIGYLVVGHMFPVVMLRGEDRHLHARALPRKEVQYLGRRPVVDEYQRPLRARDELQHQRPRIPELPVIEHTAQRRFRRIKAP